MEKYCNPRQRGSHTTQEWTFGSHHQLRTKTCWRDSWGQGEFRKDSGWERERLPVGALRPTAITGVIIHLTDHLLLSFPSERNVDGKYTEASSLTWVEEQNYDPKGWMAVTVRMYHMYLLLQGAYTTKVLSCYAVESRGGCCAKATPPAGLSPAMTEWET